MIQYKLTTNDQSADTIEMILPTGVETIDYTDSSEALPISTQFMPAHFGLTLHAYEAAYFKAHYFIWNHFLTNTNDNWCLVAESNVHLKASAKDWAELLTELPENTDLFFPFGEPSPKETIEVQPATKGYFWGSHIYLLSKAGAEKLVKYARLRQPLDEELLFLTSRKVITTFHADTQFFSYKRQASPSLLARKQQLSNAIFNLPGWNDHTKTLAQKLLAVLSGLAKSCNVNLVLHGGTLLGAIRHNSIMPWDDDIDLGMCIDDVNTLLECLSASSEVRWTEWSGVFRGVKTQYYKVWLPEGDDIPGYPYKFPFVDIWLYYPEENNMHYKEWPAFNSKLYFPLKTMQFEGSIFHIPGDTLGFLDFLFADWRTHIKVYTYSHRIERTAFKPLKCAIKVDAKGRFKSIA